MAELLYKDITYDIRGACFWVYKEFGGAFKEKIVERALISELIKRRKRKIETQKKIDIYYLDEKVGCYIPDLVVDDKVIVEVKCKEFITKQDIDQLWKYLKGSKHKLGLLINFGPKGLEIKRIVYDTAREKPSNKARLATNPRSRLAPDRYNGFTLVETLIYLAIIGIVAVSFIGFSISITNTRNKAYVVQEVQANARMALDLISQRVRAANGINTGSSVFGADPGSLSLSMADAAKDPTLINLSADDGILQITEDTDGALPAAIPITSNKIKATNLVFTNLTSSGSRENIRIEITLEYDNPSSDVEYNYTQSLQTTVSLRQ